MEEDIRKKKVIKDTKEKVAKIRSQVADEEKPLLKKLEKLYGPPYTSTESKKAR